MYVCMCVCVCARAHACARSCSAMSDSMTPWTVALQASLRGSPDPEIELGSPALQVDSLPTELSGMPHIGHYRLLNQVPCAI